MALNSGISKSLFLAQNSMSDIVYEALNPPMQKVFNINMSPGLITGMVFTALFLVFAVIVRLFCIPKFKKAKVPGKFQMFLEYLVTYFHKSSSEQVHRHANFIGPYLFTSASFIAITTLAELIGFTPAFSSINTCIAFGLMTFIIINIAGVRQFGVFKRAKRWLNPINVVTDISIPLSLSLRLFGSVTSGFIIVELIYSSIYTSIALPAAVYVVTTLFHAGIQAFLFATLSNIFVSEAVET
jgi:F-type H+-transporting ATPase subunit a